MDFGALPPEINSARMYTGPGAGPMIAAAAAWDRLAAELGSTASSYQSEIAGLTSGSWRGPTATAMSAAAAPYTVWMSATAAQAEQTATQARAAAAAYETAFAATVPPPVIAANRSLLASLVATNIFGQNTPAISATEAHYGEMWAQDAAAMYGYAGSSATASQVTPFTQAPQTTNPAGAASQAAAVAQATGSSAANSQSTFTQLISSVPQLLQSLTSPVSSAAPAAAADASNPVASTLIYLTGPTSPISYFPLFGVPYLLGFQSYLLPQAQLNYLAAEKAARPKAPGAPLLEDAFGPGTRVLGAQSVGGAGPAVSAGMGRAGLVGGLSVPQGWATAAPAMKPVALVLSETSAAGAPAAAAEGSQGSLLSSLGLSSLAGRAAAGTGGTAARSASVGSGATFGESATTATIFVIPAADE